MPMQAASLEIELIGARDTLATKQDLLELKMELKMDVSSLRTEFKGDIAGLRAEMHALAASSNRQMYGALLGQMAVLLGIAYFFVTQLRH